jgi:hypothetical protein
LEIVTVLKRLEASDAAVAGQGFALAHYGRVEDALAILEAQATQATDPQASASLLAVGARLAEEFGPEASAVTLRRAIVDGYPDAREWPESALRLGRALARSTTGQAEARELLQRLVLAHSDHPLAADARRALERLTGGSDE